MRKLSGSVVYDWPKKTLENPVLKGETWATPLQTIPGVQLRREVSVSSISDFFERMHRKEQLNPTSHLFTVGGGILFILAGAVVEMRTRDLSRALPYTAIGLGMTFFSITQTKVRTSPLRWVVLLAEIALWVGGVYWLVRTLF
jgi:hypothetical protein